MKYNSVFDIIGPIMVGPSSSHTAGAAKIALYARKAFSKEPSKAVVTFYGSFAKTYKGHGTDIAIAGGILGMDTADKNLVSSLEIAKENGVDIQFILSDDIPIHPNTVKIALYNGEDAIELTGISIGGGTIEIIGIDDYKINMIGEANTTLIWHYDRVGVIVAVTKVLAEKKINIASMEVARKNKNELAIMALKSDGPLTKELVAELNKLSNVVKVTHISE